MHLGVTASTSIVSSFHRHGSLRFGSHQGLPCGWHQRHLDGETLPSSGQKNVEVKELTFQSMGSSVEPDSKPQNSRHVQVVMITGDNQATAELQLHMGLAINP